MEDGLSSPLEVVEPTEVAPSQALDPPKVATPTPEIDNAEISKFFGFDPSEIIEQSDRDYLKTIWNYFATQAKTPGEVIRLISEKEREVAPPKQGESRLGKFYIYVRLLEEQQSVRSELSAYKK